ncbi:uncharacterized [Tachysurus ichikawai]
MEGKPVLLLSTIPVPGAWAGHDGTYRTHSAVNKAKLFGPAAVSARQSSTHANRDMSGQRNVSNANARALTKACDFVSNRRRKWV